MAKVDVARAAQRVLTRENNRLLKLLGSAASGLSAANYNKFKDRVEEANKAASKAIDSAKALDFSDPAFAAALGRVVELVDIEEAKYNELKKAEGPIKTAKKLADANDVIDDIAAMSQVMHGRRPTVGEITATVAKDFIASTPVGAVAMLIDSFGDKHPNVVSKLTDIVIDKPAAQLDKLPGFKQINQFTQEVASGVKEVTPDSVRNLVTGLANVPDALVGGLGDALKEIGGAVAGRPSQRIRDELFQAIEKKVGYLADSGMTRDEIASYFVERADDKFTGSVTFDYPSGQAEEVEREFPGTTYGDVYSLIIDKEGPLANQNEVSLLDQMQALDRFAEPETIRLVRGDDLLIYDDATGERVSPYRIGEILNRNLPYEMRDDYSYHGYDTVDYGLGKELTRLDASEAAMASYKKQKQDEYIRPQPFEGPPELIPLPGSAGQPSLDPLSGAAQGFGAKDRFEGLTPQQIQDIQLAELYPQPLPGSAGQPGIDPLREATLQPGDSVEAARASGYELPQAPYSGQPEYDPTNYDPIYGGAPPMGAGTPAYTPTPPAPVEPTPPAPAPVLDPLLPTSPRFGEEPLFELDAIPSPVVPQTAIREPVQTRPIDPLMPQITPFTQAPALPAVLPAATPVALPAATPVAYPVSALSRQNYEDMAPRGRARGEDEARIRKQILDDILKDGKQQPRKQTQMPALSPAMKTRIF